MDVQNRMKGRTEKRSSLTSASGSSGSSIINSKKINNSFGSKFTKIDGVSRSSSIKKRNKKKVTFKTNFIEVIKIDSFKEFNNSGKIESPKNKQCSCKCCVF